MLIMLHMYIVRILVNLLVAVPPVSVIFIVKSNGIGVPKITCTYCGGGIVCIRYDDFLKNTVVATRL